MKRYNSLDYTFESYRERCERNPGKRICVTNIDTRDLLEAIIKPDLYFKVLKNIFNRIENKVKNLKSSKEICEFLTKEFTSFKIIFKLESIDYRQSNGLNSGGTDDDMFNTIYIFCNPLLKDEINNEYKKVVDKIILILQHEFIHRNQAIRMKSMEIISKNFRDKETAYEYYSDKQELMAYAWHVVEILRRKGIDNKKILNALKNGSIIEENYNYIVDVLGINSKEIKRFHKYMYEYLQ